MPCLFISLSFQDLQLLAVLLSAAEVSSAIYEFFHFQFISLQAARAVSLLSHSRVEISMKIYRATRYHSYRTLYLKTLSTGLGWGMCGCISMLMIHSLNQTTDP